MKVYISNYRSHWLSPYTILEKIYFWREIDYDEPFISKMSDILYPFCESARKFLDFVHPQITYVKIDRWDTWSMDHTLANLIVPMLKQLKNEKHGSPYVDDEDVPDELKSTNAPAKVNDYDIDDNHFLRWDYVLNEMIQAFECKLNDDWHEQYRSGNIDNDLVYVDAENNVVPKKDSVSCTFKEGPNHTYKVDWDQLRKHEERNQNGYRLFGKYYTGLWD